MTPVLARTVHVPAQAVTLPWPTTGQAAIAVPSIGIDVASGARAAGAGGEPDQADDRLRRPARPPAGARPTGPDHHRHPGRRRRLRQRHRRRRLQRAGDARRAADRAAGARRTARALGGQLRRPARPLGRREHSRLRGEDERRRGRVSAWPTRTSPTPAGSIPARCRPPSDLLKVAAPDMANAAFASMVQMPSVTLPVAGTISTYTPFLGLDGVIGVKSGFTTAAGGCDVLAVVRTVHGKPVLLLAAVTGQTGPEVLAQAGLHGLALVDALGPLIGSTAVLARRPGRGPRQRGRRHASTRRTAVVGVHADLARRHRDAGVPTRRATSADQARRGHAGRHGGGDRRHPAASPCRCGSSRTCRRSRCSSACSDAPSLTPCAPGPLRRRRTSGRGSTRWPWPSTAT